MILLHDRPTVWLGHAQNLGAKSTLNFNTLQIRQHQDVMAVTADTAFIVGGTLTASQEGLR